jgi:hypothetical protein
MEPSEWNRLVDKYRDRAKERQDGIVVDDENDTSIDFTTNRMKTYDKDDEIFDSVVAAIESGDRQQLKRITTTSTTTSTFIIGKSIPMTATDAYQWIINKQYVAKTTLGNDILQYLRKRYIKTTTLASVDTTIPVVSAAGRVLQTSVLTFNNGINVDTRDRYHSWERPIEQTYAMNTTTKSHSRSISIQQSTDFRNDNDGIIPKASGVVYPVGLLQQIQRCFDERDRRTHKRNTELQTTSTCVPVEKEQENVTSADKSNDDADDDDDDDDDIFDNVGEYNPDDDDDNENKNDDVNTNDETSKTTAVIHHSGGDVPKITSVFGEPMTTGQSNILSTVTKPTQHPSDPDMESDDHQSSTNLPQHKKSLQGLSSLYYPGGGYDNDGIGLDFDGGTYDDDHDDEHYDKDSNSNKKDKRLTRKRGGKK